MEEANDESYKRVLLQAFIHPDVEDDARCLGYLSTFYDNPEFGVSCALPPYGSALYLNSKRDVSRSSSQMWQITSVDGAKGEFKMIASNKPDVCLRVLAAEDCGSQPALVEDSTSYSANTIKYKTWKIVKRYDLVAKSSPPPSPSPLPPAVPAPGPVISGPTSSTSGYVSVRIESIGGDNGCAVSSILLTSIGAAVGSLPKTVEVSTEGLNTVSVQLGQRGYNSIYAVGNCNNGGRTERSNSLTVFNTVPGPPSPPPPPPKIVYAYVSDTDNDYITSCIVSGSSLTGCTNSTGTGFSSPIGIAISGSIAFVANSGDNTVTSCTIAGPLLTNCTDSGGTGFTGATGIAISGSTAFVTNKIPNTVTSCTISGSSLTGCTDSGGTGFGNPQGIAISGTTAFVTNESGSTISSCTISGSSLTGCTNSGATNVNGPVAITVSGSTALVANYAGNSVTSCTISGSTLNCSPSGGTGFNVPTGIAISGTTAFVVNYDAEYAQSTDYVSSCRISGSSLTNCVNSGATSLNVPWGIVIDA